MTPFASTLAWDLLSALERERPVTREADRDLSEARTFEAIYRDHYRDVYRYVVLSLRGSDDVDDVVADTFQRAFAAWRSGHGPAARALPWLLVIARRLMVDRWRRERLIRWLPFADRSMVEAVEDDDPGGRAEFWIWLGELSRALPAKQRDVVFLRYQRDLTDEEIGEILGLSASGVRTLVSRALARLRQHPELWA
jgi:RNA polymerase sigma-70 factor (ECF subfamily)